MDKPITIEAFKLEGFRAFLQSQTVNLRRGNKPLSLAVFAPNAKANPASWTPSSTIFPKMRL